MNDIIQYLSKEFNGFKPTHYRKHKIHFVFSTWTCYKTQLMTELQRNTIIINAEKLKNNNIPFVLIYSRLNMTFETEQKLYLLFPNFICILCIEDVLFFHIYSHVYVSNLIWMDYIRIAVIKNYRIFLQALRYKAPKNIIKALNSNEGNSLMYVDSDLEFISTNNFEIYTANGMCSYPQLNAAFNYSDKTGQLKNHETAFNYVISGKAYEDARKDYILKKRNCKPVIAYGENCMISVRYDAVDLFKRCIGDQSLSIDFHKNPNRDKLHCSDPLYAENHTFIYLQLLKHLRHRHDLSWTSN